MPLPPDNAPAGQNSPKAKIREITHKWKQAYFTLVALNFITIGAAFQFARTLHKDYEKTIRLDDYWSDAMIQIVSLNDHLVSSNVPANRVFDTLDPTLERFRKGQANEKFKTDLNKIRTHLARAPNHIDQLERIESELDKIEAGYRILDAYAEAIFDSISFGQIETASSLMATMDIHASESSSMLTLLSHSISNLQEMDFANGQEKSKKLTQFEYLLLALIASILGITLFFGHKMSGFLNMQVTETEKSRERADTARHELRSQSFALDQHSIVAITDTAGRITYANDRFCEVSQYQRSELIGQDHRILNSGHHPKAMFVDMRKDLARGDVWKGEIKNRAKDGSHYWVDTTIVPYRDEAGHIYSYVAIRTDITEQIEAEQNLEAALQAANESSERAERANAAKSDFLATMSHEIRTPMNSIVGFANLLIESDLPDQSREFAKSILGSGQGLLSVINDILDFSKIEAGKLETESVPIDLRRVIGEAVELLSAQAEEKDLELLFQFSPGNNRSLISDPGRIRQIVINLVGNAIKFTRQGHVIVRVEPDPEKPSSFLRISVEDTGVGIPDQAQKHLFNKFTQADSSTSRIFGGTGLGLSICKHLVVKLGGQISLSSIQGEGSTFWFSLPAKADEESPNAESQNQIVPGIRILIVDDHRLSQELIQTQLEPWGFSCDTASSAVEAIEKIARAQRESKVYQVALVDEKMPDTDGIALAKQIKASHPDIRLVALASNASLVGGVRFAEVGYENFVMKPLIWPERLKEALECALSANTRQNSATRLGKQSAFGSAPQGNYRILIVDDTELNQVLLRTIFEEKFGYKTDTAANGQEAIEAWRERPYDAIFMDCMMPIVDGFEATRLIRSEEIAKRIKRTPIIALTANALVGDAQSCFDCGMDDYLTKPIAPEKLAFSLNRWLPEGEQTKGRLTLETPKQNKANDYLDITRLESLFPTGDGMIEQILSTFSRNISELVEKLAKTKDPEKIANIAHTIKGSAAECGARPLSKAAQGVEKAIKERHSELLPDLLQTFGKTAIATLNEISKALELREP
ncbi:PAS domain-containing hybrid sensor histidine kinase/response regulator [Pelagicoccus albus]|uniref:Sensory/regulatory protein RpfC n=1 Tax=Pelagicoccus albus TaxID=415222 RepID=A0A7X1E9G3_9BACT|nr:response regulator [Pelagicoccus albus]MBC2607384.1 response regulator [Pelagicoccus albus]